MMSYFDSIYSKIFDKGGKSPVLIHEVIKRSQSFLNRFQSWKTSELSNEFLNEVWQSYFWKKKGIDKNPQVYILESQYSNGFSISYESEYDKIGFHFLFDYIAEQVKKLDYKLTTSRLTIKEKGDNVEKVELHYLKPKRNFVEPIDQCFGNVQIEYTEINNQPEKIRLIANSYPDRKYKEAKNFEELAQHIFNLGS